MPQKKQTYLLLFVFSVGYSSNAQLTFFSDLYISEGSELHIAFKETYFNGGKVFTSRVQNLGILSFGKESLWKQLQQDSFVDGIVRIYHNGNFTFPIGEGRIFSPLTLYSDKNEGHFEVYYQNYNSQFYPTLSDNFRIPQFHFWKWKASPSTSGNIKVYWSKEHDLMQLVTKSNQPNSLEIALLEKDFWSNKKGVLSNNPFFPSYPLSIGYGAIQMRENLDLNSYESMSLLVPIDHAIEHKKVSQVLTPNGDGFNDTWKISGYTFTPRTIIRVFDHGGSIVFEHKGSYTNHWDGTSSQTGTKLKQGSYYYRIDLANPTSTVLKGWIYIKYQ